MAEALPAAILVDVACPHCGLPVEVELLAGSVHARGLRECLKLRFGAVRCVQCGVVGNP